MLMQLDDARNMVMSSHDSATTTTKAEEAVFSSTTASTNVAAMNAKHHKSPSLSSMNALPHQTTTNQWSGSSPEALALAFGENRKAHMAARAMFELVHQFGDNLREGWKNVLDLLLQLLRADLLPVQLLLLEDFVDPRGKVSLKEHFRRRQAVPKKEESGLFSWLGFTSSSGPSESDPKRPSEEERELFKLAASVISECHPEQLVPDSRYLAGSALTELINNIVHCSIALAPHEQAEHVPAREQQQHHESQGSQSQDDDSLVDLSPAAALLPKHGHGPGVVHHQQHDHPDEKHTSNCSNSEGHGRHSGPGHPPQPVVFELSMEEEEALVFLLELMVNIVLENRDRLAQVWPLVSDHLGWLLSHFPRNRQLMERAVVSLVRIANRNLFRLGQQQPQTVAKASEVPRKKGGGGQNMAKSVVIVVDEDEQQQNQQSQDEEFKTFSPGHHPPDQSIQGRTNECLADLVLHFMGTRLLALRPPELFLHSRPIAYGLHTLLRANAANVHSGEHWSMFFELLEAVGAAQYPEGEGEEAEQYFLVEPNSRANATSASKQKSRKSAAQHARAVHATAAMAQSEPEEMAASPERRQQQQQAVDERGYCSDEPSSAVAMECGQKAGERRPQQNPLLAAAEQLRLPQLGKADSGEEWIHVVGPAGMQKAVDEHQLQQLGKIREHGAPAEQLQLSAVPLSAPVGHGQHVQADIPPPSAIESGTNADGQQNQAEQQFHAPQVQAVQPQKQQPEQPVPSSPPEAVDEPAVAAVPVPCPPPPPPHPRAGLFKRGTIVLAPHLSRHDPAAFLRVVDTLVFLARDAAHITPANFTQFTRCLRVMVEASMDGGKMLYWPGGIAHLLRNSIGTDSDNYLGVKLLWEAAQTGANLDSKVSKDLHCVQMSVGRTQAPVALSILGELVQPALKPWDVLNVDTELDVDLKHQTVQEKVLEGLHRAAFRNGSLAQPLLASTFQIGSEGSPRHQKLASFLLSRWKSAETALIGVNIDHSLLLEYASDHSPVAEGKAQPADPSPFLGGELHQHGPGPLAHVAICGQGARRSDDQAMAVQAVLCALMGQSGQYTANDNIPQPGLVHRAVHRAANHNPFQLSPVSISHADMGLVGFYLLAEGTLIRPYVKAALQGLRELANAPVDGEMLENAKRAVSMEKLIAVESTEQLAIDQAVQVMAKGMAQSPADELEAVRKVTAEDVKKAAAQLCSKLALSAYGKVNQVPYLDEM